MAGSKKKITVTLLIAVGALPVIAFAALTVTYTVRSLAREKTMWSYLQPYEAETIDYLRQNEAFTDLYGDGVPESSSSISYGYTDPKKYTGLSLNPQIPASAELFHAELDHLSVSFDLPDLRTISVNFERTPEGRLEIVGWEYADE